MSNQDDVKNDFRGPLDSSPQVPEIPTGVDRRKFIVRSAVISAAVLSRAGRPRAQIETAAPACANASAIERPMPLLPPATTARLPSRLSCIEIPLESRYEDGATSRLRSRAPRRRIGQERVHDMP